ncbi:MAG: ATPase, T2SS/T4P/T4SS family [Tepidisphaeraceae bacterium]
MQAFLDVKEANGQRRIPLEDGPLTIGRNFTNLLVLDETQASRFHCVIEKGPEGYAVRDLESRNGTRVNGTAVRAAVLYDGDVVSIGKTEMRLHIPSAAKPKAGAVEDDPFQQLADLVSGVTPAGSPAQEDISTDESDGLEQTVIEPPQTTIVANNEYERVLRERAEALADRSFGENSITLINARGKPAYNAEKEVGEAVIIIRLVLLICFRSRATDIHVEPRADEVLVRIRVDGQMVDVIHMNRELGVKLLSAVKVVSDIDIAQRNIVQEGHFAARVPGRSGSAAGAERQVDYRVSFAPAMHGQKLVIRILDAANAPLHIDDLQLPAKAKEIIKKASSQESGMILVGGPTGSGKTTSLYAILRDIDVTQCNVVTIEDPVEIQLEGVTQIPVNEAQGNSFSALLRSVLRQDPDVILIGEIRDAETARVGVQAGMTGHLVFSTVHSRDALSAMFRLLDLGVEPYVLSSGLHLVVAQRLVRQLCRYCKIPHAPTPAQTKTLTEHGFPGVQKLYVSKGCRRCLNTGHLGRRAVFEVLVATPALREVILRNPTVEECRKALDPESFISMADSGYRLVAEGVAAFDELEKSIA